MSLFPHFNSGHVWMVLVQKGAQAQHLEIWLAPEGQDGVRRIFRHTLPDKRPIAAVPLPRLGLLGQKAAGMRATLSEKMHGEEQAVFVMDTEDGSCRVVARRGRTPQDAVRKCVRDNAAVGGFHMDLVRSHAWAMRRLLDQQKISGADVNLLQGDGLPVPEEDALFSKRAPLWTRQDPGDGDEA